MASRDLALTSLPLEILRLIVDNLPRFDLFSVRLLSKTFAAVAAVSVSSLHESFIAWPSPMLHISVDSGSVAKIMCP